MRTAGAVSRETPQEVNAGHLLAGLHPNVNYLEPVTGGHSPYHAYTRKRRSCPSNGGFAEPATPLPTHEAP